MKRTISIILAFVLLTASVCVLAAAKEEKKLIIVKADEEVLYEGVTAIYTYNGWGSELCREGYTFEWTAVAVFDYDKASGGFKVVAVYDIQPAKKNISIPEKGFAITSNLGNNWPELFASATGSEWFFYASSGALGIPYSECPNFITAYNSATFETMKTVKTGDIFYLCGVDILDAAVESNEDEGVHYWEDGFVSGSYLTSEKPKGYVDPFAEPEPEPDPNSEDSLEVSVESSEDDVPESSVEEPVSTETSEAEPVSEDASEDSDVSAEPVTSEESVTSEEPAASLEPSSESASESFEPSAPGGTTVLGLPLWLFIVLLCVIVLAAIVAVVLVIRKKR